MKLQMFLFFQNIIQITRTLHIQLSIFILQFSIQLRVIYHIQSRRNIKVKILYQKLRHLINIIINQKLNSYLFFTHIFFSKNQQPSLSRRNIEYSNVYTPILLPNPSTKMFLLHIEPTNKPRHHQQ